MKKQKPVAIVSDHVRSNVHQYFVDNAALGCFVANGGGQISALFIDNEGVINARLASPTSVTKLPVDSVAEISPFKKKALRQALVTAQLFAAPNSLVEQAAIKAQARIYKAQDIRLGDKLHVLPADASDSHKNVVKGRVYKIAIRLDDDAAPIIDYELWPGEHRVTAEDTLLKHKPANADKLQRLCFKIQNISSDLV